VISGQLRCCAFLNKVENGMEFLDRQGRALCVKNSRTILLKFITFLRNWSTNLLSHTQLRRTRNISACELSKFVGCKQMSSVGTVSDCGLGGRGSIPDRGRGFLL
jgi:hypothetical protein